MDKSENHLRDIVFIFFEQKKIIFWTTFLVFILSLGIALFWPPSFESSGLIMLKAKRSKRSPETLEFIDQKGLEVQKEDLVTESEILTSIKVIEKSLDYLIKKDEFIYDKKEDFAEIPYKIKKQLKIEVLPYSNIIKISYINKNPEQAYLILKEIIKFYIERRRDIFTPQGLQNFFSGQVKDFKSYLDEEEDKMFKLAKKVNSANAGMEISNNLTFKMQLEIKLNQARVDFEEYSKIAEHLRQSLADPKIKFFVFIENEAITKLAEKLQDMIIKRSEAAKIYSHQSKIMMRFDEQINYLIDELKTEVRAYYQSLLIKLSSLEQTIKDLENDIKKIEQRNINLYKAKLTWDNIQNQIKLNSQSMEVFAKRLKETQINRESDAQSLFSISVLTWPEIPFKASFPKPKLVLILGLISGFFLGICLGFVRGFFDHTLKRPEDSQRFLDMPTIFSIPLKNNKQ